MFIWKKLLLTLAVSLACLWSVVHADEFDDITAQIVLWEDIERNSNEIKNLADSGDPEAQYLWAMIHHYWNNEYDYLYQQTNFSLKPEIALHYFQLAAENKFQPAMAQMALFYFLGYGTIGINYYEASKWYKDAIVLEPVAVQGTAIEMYNHYEEVPVRLEWLSFLDRESNLVETIRFWSLVDAAVKDRDAQAAYDLGEFFRAKRDYVSTRFWNGIAMTGDIADAYAREGGYMDYPTFGEASVAERYVYYKMAADRGSDIGQQWLDHRAAVDRSAAERRNAQMAVLGLVIGLLAVIPDENLQQNTDSTCYGCIPFDLEYLWLQ